MKRYRIYREEDEVALRANLGPVAAVEIEKLDEALCASLHVWSVETDRGLTAVGGVVAQSLMSDECFAWLLCTRACDARYMKRLVGELLARYRVVHVALAPGKARSVRFAEWLGFRKVGVLEGFDHYVLRRP